MSGDRDKAVRLLRSNLERSDMNLLRQELSQDLYALGLLLGGTEGAGQVAEARAALLECGISDPDANMRAYVPELLRVAEST